MEYLKGNDLNVEKLDACLRARTIKGRTCRCYIFMRACTTGGAFVSLMIGLNFSFIKKSFSSL